MWSFGFAGRQFLWTVSVIVGSLPLNSSVGLFPELEDRHSRGLISGYSSPRLSTACIRGEMLRYLVSESEKHRLREGNISEIRKKDGR